MKLPKIKVQTWLIKPITDGGYTWVGSSEKILIKHIETLDKDKFNNN